MNFQIVIHLTLIVLLVFLCFRLLGEKSLHKLLALSVVFAISLWYIAPGVLAIALPLETLLSPLTSGVAEDEFLFAYALEVGSLCLIVTAILLISRIFRVRQHDAVATPHSNATTAFILVLFFFSTLAHMLFGMTEYLEANAASLYDEKAKEAPFAVFRQILAAAVVLLAVSQNSKGKVFYVAFGLICADSVLAVISGSRIALITPIVILAFKLFDRRLVSRKNIALGIIAFVSILVVVVPISSLIQHVRMQGLVTEVPEYVEIDEGMELLITNVASMIFIKFDSFSTGVSLLNGAGGPGAGGMTPYIGSALVFVPRAVWPNRPVAGSSDGTIYGHPSRIVPSSFHFPDDSYNVGVSPLHVVIWQLGYIGSLVFIIASIGFLFLINSLLKSDYYSSTLGVFLLSIPSFHRLIASPDVTLMQVALVFPLVFLVKLSRPKFWKVPATGFSDGSRSN